MTTANSGYFPLLPSSYLQNSSDTTLPRPASGTAASTSDSHAQGRFGNSKYAAAKRPPYDHWLESVERQRIRQRAKRRQMALHARCFLPIGCDAYALAQLECETTQAELRVHNPELSSSEEEEEEEEGEEEEEEEDEAQDQYDLADEGEAELAVEEEEEEEDADTMDEEALMALAEDMDEADVDDEQDAGHPTPMATTALDMTAHGAAMLDGEPTPWLRRASHEAQRVMAIAARFAVSTITRRDAEAADSAGPSSDDSSMEIVED